MSAHEEDDKLHLHLTMDATLQLKKDNMKLRNDVSELRRDLHSAMNILRLTLMPEPHTYRLTNYQHNKELGGYNQFKPFTTHPCGYTMAFRVIANGEGASKGTHIRVSAPILPGEYDSQLKWPLLGKIVFTLLNQLENKNHHSKVATLTKECNAKVGSLWGVPKFIAHSELGYDPVRNTQYLKDDTLHFRMTVEIQSK